MSREHELKTWPEPFAAILDGTKRHEVRRNDRGFAVGHALHLREWLPGRWCLDCRTLNLTPKGWDDVQHERTCGACHGNLSRAIDGDYTGRSIRARVTHLTPGGLWGLPADVCVMSIEVTAPDARCERAEAILADIRDEIAALTRHRDARDRGGQHVGTGGRLSSAPLSIERVLREWLAKIDGAMPVAPPQDGPTAEDFAQHARVMQRGADAVRWRETVEPLIEVVRAEAEREGADPMGIVDLVRDMLAAAAPTKEV
mgnify:CR=1 FL=1